MIDRLPSVRALRALEATARLGSFTAAAAELNVTQGAVSRQMQELERLLGVSLVVRSGPKIALTDQGRRFVKTARVVLQELKEGIAAIAAPEQKRHVTICMLPSVAAKWLAPRLGSFLSEHPDIDFRVSATRRLSSLVAEEIDAAIRYGRGQWPGLQSEWLASETLFPVCSPGYAKANELNAPEDLLRTMLLPAEIAEDWAVWFETAGVDAKQITEGPMLGDYVAILQAAIDGHGVALGRSVLVDDDLAAGRLVRLFEIELEASSGYWFVIPENSAPHDGLETVREWIVRELGNDM